MRTVLPPLLRNPFSDTYEEQRYDTQAADYGRPTKGSLTEKRGIRAGIFNHLSYLTRFRGLYSQRSYPSVRDNCEAWRRS